MSNNSSCTKIQDFCTIHGDILISSDLPCQRCLKLNELRQEARKIDLEVPQVSFSSLDSILGFIILDVVDPNEHQEFDFVTLEGEYPQRDIEVEYVLPRNTKFGIQLINPTLDSVCLCTVLINGSKIGGWKLTSGEIYDLKCATSGGEGFTFLKDEAMTDCESITSTSSPISSSSSGSCEVTVIYEPQANSSYVTVRLKKLLSIDINVLSTDTVAYLRSQIMLRDDRYRDGQFELYFQDTLLEEGELLGEYEMDDKSFVDLRLLPSSSCGEEEDEEQRDVHNRPGVATNFYSPPPTAVKSHLPIVRRKDNKRHSSSRASSLVSMVSPRSESSTNVSFTKKNLATTSDANNTDTPTCEQLTIKSLLSSFSVDFNALDTVLDVKEKICASEGLSPRRFHLLHCGVKLDDEATLSRDCGIKKGDTLHLILHVHSGGCYACTLNALKVCSCGRSANKKTSSGSKKCYTSTSSVVKQKLTKKVRYEYIDEVTVFVQAASRKRVAVTFLLQDLVCELKHKIHNKLHIAACDQQLFFQGVEMSDEEANVCAYGITEGSDLQLVVLSDLTNDSAGGKRQHEEKERFNYFRGFDGDKSRVLRTSVRLVLKEERVNCYKAVSEVEDVMVVSNDVVEEKSVEAAAVEGMFGHSVVSCVHQIGNWFGSFIGMALEY